MAILKEKTWVRHANPWSGWTRVLLMPMIAFGLYFHSYWILGATIVWGIVNPLIFPKPKQTDNWMSEGVLGEELYFKEGKKLRKDLPTLLNLINIPVFFSFLFFSWQQEVWAMVFSGLLVMVVKFWFIDRMVAFYKKERK